MGEEKKGEKVEVFKGPQMKDPPAPPAPAGKMHVSLYLKSRDTKLWHREGKSAFAKAKGKEFATEAEFDSLFKQY